VKYAGSDAFKDLRNRVSDSLLAASGSPTATVDRPALMRCMQLVGVVEWLSERKGATLSEAEVDAAIRSVVLLPDDALPPPAPPRRRALRATASHSLTIESDERAVVPPRDALVAARHDLENVLGLGEDGRDTGTVMVLSDEAPDFTSSIDHVSARLARGTLAVLDHLSIGGDAGVLGALNSLNDVITAHVPNFDVDGALPDPAPDPASAEAVPRYWLSMDDLFVVKRTRVKYELGEVAHVENVMGREKRKREHTRFSETETSATTETEREEIQERDVQISDRFEIEKALESTFSSALNINASVELEAKPNPALTIRTALGASFSSASSEAQRTASRNAKETVEKSAQRVRTRVVTERQTRTLLRFEELNMHGFDNTESPEHIVGAYRWLDKIERFQTYNFGRRLLIELIVPEPAAFWKYLQASTANGDLGPPPPKLKDPFTGADLEPRFVSPASWQLLAAQVDAADVPAPPPLYRIASGGWSSEASSGDPTKPHTPFYLGGDTAKIEIPDGYGAKSFVGQFMTGQWLAANEGQRGAADSTLTVSTAGVAGPTRLAVGELGATLSKGSSRVSAVFPVAPNEVKPPGGDIAVGLRAEMSDGYALTVHVLCERTPEEYAQWQMMAYGALLSAYNAKAEAYRQALRAQEASEVQIQGRPPQESERIIRNELQKLCIQAISSYDFSDVNGVGVSDPIGSSPPTLTTEGADRWRSKTYFFETSFDWRLMQWSFLPYAWGDRARWSDLAGRQDTDPDFAAFLRAGGSAILLPVKLGSEDAVTHFLDTGEVWGPGPAPQTRRLLDAIGDVRTTPPLEGVAVDEPWDVRLPTNLTVLDGTDWDPPTINYADDA
jgi:hypothetical protein